MYSAPATSRCDSVTLIFSSLTIIIIIIYVFGAMRLRLRLGWGIGLGLWIGLGSGFKSFDYFRHCAICIARNTEGPHLHKHSQESVLRGHSWGPNGRNSRTKGQSGEVFLKRGQQVPNQPAKESGEQCKLPQLGSWPDRKCILDALIIIIIIIIVIVATISNADNF